MALSILVMNYKESGRAVRATRRSGLVIALVVATLASAATFAEPALAQERAWVRGEIRLNLRSGAGTQYRILGGVATGDGLRVLERGDGWTKVGMSDGTQGWIPKGYLEAEPPPTIRLAQLETEVTTLRDRLSTTTGEAEKYRAENETLASTDGLQRTEIERLIFDNTKLRAGARYPELIAGASILAAGMILGAMLHRSSSNRRPTSRIRL